MVRIGSVIDKMLLLMMLLMLLSLLLALLVEMMGGEEGGRRAGRKMHCRRLRGIKKGGARTCPSQTGPG